jgi:hypothetical protein
MNTQWKTRLGAAFSITLFVLFLFAFLVMGYVHGARQADSKSLYLLRMTRKEVSDNPHELLDLLRDMRIDKTQTGNLILETLGYKARRTEISDALQKKGQDLVLYLIEKDATKAGALERKKEITALVDRMMDERIDSWFELRDHIEPEKLAPLYHYVEKNMESSPN